MEAYVKGSSTIRAMFEEGKKLSDLYGKENVYDFSLGNPNVAPPKEVKEAIIHTLETEEATYVHGYMNNSGYEDVRSAIAASLNERFATSFDSDNILMTVGAAGGLNVIFKTLLDPEDEVIVFAPYFGEYENYAANYQGKLVVVSPNTADFQPNMTEFEQKITAKTKGVIINSPNNPTGVIYSEKTIQALAEILERKQREFHSDIYIISDEPYRELAYDDVFVPYIPKYYANTIVGYSYSKSLSLPGERIGYIVLPKELSDFDNIVIAANVANRILGYVNAPSLMQRTVMVCVNTKVDTSYYNRNRQTLYEGLKKAGYECIMPQGAFYLFVKSPLKDDIAFCAWAKKYHILLVPGTSFACPGYFRIAYCVTYETIVNALPQFEKLMDDVKSGNECQ